MSCNYPIKAWRPLAGGALAFREVKDAQPLEIPCGRCIGCRIRRRDAWAVRCVLEAKMHAHNEFLTLTYDDDHMPAYGGLWYRDWQLFAKKLRKAIGPFRFFVAGEYGEEKKRPHWHAILFGAQITQKKLTSSMYSENPRYESEVISRLWDKGFHTLSGVGLESARYVAKYAVKKLSGPLAKERYGRVDLESGEVVYVAAEFARMSLKPGIGATWIEKYWPEVYQSGHDKIHLNGYKARVPKYFDDFVSRLEVLGATGMDSVEYERLKRAQALPELSAEQLEVREECLRREMAFFENMRETRL